jgi:hypothetical protein
MKAKLMFQMEFVSIKVALVQAGCPSDDTKLQNMKMLTSSGTSPLALTIPAVTQTFVLFLLSPVITGRAP